MPTFLVDMVSPKCFDIDAPQDTIIKIIYEAPGMLQNNLLLVDEN
jgi:hypothetical protein